MKKTIIFVPGKNPKPEPELHIQYLRRCLIEGVSRQSIEVAQQILEQDAFELCAWNFDFYQQHLDFTPLLESIDNVCRKTRATTKDKLFANTWKNTISKIIYQAGDRFPRLINLLADDHVKAMLHDTDRYFDNIDGIADQVRKILIDLLCGYENKSKILLIGHSLGSVIAYDSLYQIRSEKKLVDLFLTLGSPLGLHYTQERLLGYSRSSIDEFPKSIKNWHNVSASGDLISVDKTLADAFFLMKEYQLVDKIVDHNKQVYCWYQNLEGYNFHSSYGYFLEPTVAKIITNWWEEN